MDVYTAIKERKSSRNFLPDVIDNEMIEKIIKAGVQVPSLYPCFTPVISF